MAFHEQQDFSNWFSSFDKRSTTRTNDVVMASQMKFTIVTIKYQVLKWFSI